MHIGLRVVGMALLAIGGGAVAALARQRGKTKEPDTNEPDPERLERLQARESKFKSRLATLEEAIAKAEARLAEKKSELAQSDPDRWLRTFLETEHPALIDPATTDLYKIEWLRHWVYRSIPHGKYGRDLDPIAFDVIHRPVAEVLRELNEQRAGFLCAGMAWVLYRLYDVFGYPACTMDLGGPDHGTDSHMVTLVELPTSRGTTWSVQDPYFDYTLEDHRGRPLDVRRAMHLLSLGKTGRVCIRETETPKPFLVLPTSPAIDTLEAAGASELPGDGVHRRFLHPHSPSVFRDWHPQILQQIAERLGQADGRLLFLVPQHTHGDRRFRTLLPFAARKLKRYRERVEPLHLIYSIGKTGTQTIERSLEQARVRGPVRRTHILSKAAIREHSRAAGGDALTSSQASHVAQAAEARGIRRLLARQRAIRQRVPDLPPIRVVCGVREPVAQLLSRVFEDPARYLGSLDWLTPDRVSTWLEALRLDAPDDARAHALYFTDWFDNEL